ncbi:MAG: sigma-70 family RNA polymerase sigma factor [Planctomycetota bacterium]
MQPLPVESQIESSENPEDEIPARSLDPKDLQSLKDDPDKTLSKMFSERREAFWSLVAFRMDPRLLQRLDPEDILQEAFISAKKRVHHLIASPQYTLFQWMRMIVVQTLFDVHRRHLGVNMRDAGREVKLGGGNAGYYDSTCHSLAQQIAASQTSPTGAVVRDEALAAMEALVGQLSDQDQEIIAMRHFENLSNIQVAELLGLSLTGASNRYVRALARLRDQLESHGVGLPK